MMEACSGDTEEHMCSHTCTVTHRPRSLPHTHPPTQTLLPRRRPRPTMADPWLGDGTVSYLRKGVPLGKDERKAAPRVLTYRLPLATAAGGRVGGGGGLPL